ncbi:hypothetical protein HYV44_00735 [Candidatus Microgenomates bacterium]|nr:hypothetical protein [Candidatus Microgenomates bacterium]
MGRRPTVGQLRQLLERIVADPDSSQTLQVLLRDYNRLLEEGGGGSGLDRDLQILLDIYNQIALQTRLEELIVEVRLLLEKRKDMQWSRQEETLCYIAAITGEKADFDRALEEVQSARQDGWMAASLVESLLEHGHDGLAEKALGKLTSASSPSRVRCRAMMAEKSGDAKFIEEALMNLCLIRNSGIMAKARFSLVKAQLKIGDFVGAEEVAENISNDYQKTLAYRFIASAYLAKNDEGKGASYTKKADDLKKSLRSNWMYGSDYIELLCAEATVPGVTREEVDALVKSVHSCLECNDYRSSADVDRARLSIVKIRLSQRCLSAARKEMARIVFNHDKVLALIAIAEHTRKLKDFARAHLAIQGLKPPSDYTPAELYAALALAIKKAIKK